MTDCDHCWHSTGYGTVLGNYAGGSEEHKCCHCGEVKMREWHSRAEPMEGHGPHIKRSVRVYADEGA